jgi:hypothetical protein
MWCVRNWSGGKITQTPAGILGWMTYLNVSLAKAPQAETAAKKKAKKKTLLRGAPTR